LKFCQKCATGKINLLAYYPHGEIQPAIKVLLQLENAGCG